MKNLLLLGCLLLGGSGVRAQADYPLSDSLVSTSWNRQHPPQLADTLKIPARPYSYDRFRYLEPSVTGALHALFDS